MAIQNRRGVYNNFTPSKMVPGEFAVVQSGDPNGKDGKAVYIAFGTGDARRLATADDIEQEIDASTESIADALVQRFEDEVADDMETAQTAATNANTSAQTASTKASEAAQSASQAAETVANIIDNTLTQTGKAADSKVVGDEIKQLAARVDTIEEEEGLHRYGVSGIGQAAAALTRIWDSVGMTAQVGTDGDNSNVINNFDNAAPFMRRKCVGKWQLRNGHATFVVHAYEGDEDYTEDGTMGDYVAVECPRCYYYMKDGILGVSAHQYEGWRPFDIFCEDHDPEHTIPHVYIPAYALALKDGHAVSLPGLDNEQGAYKTLVDAARTYDGDGVEQFAIIQPAAVNFYEWALFTVEFATQNCQNIMQGCCSLRHNADDRVTFVDATHAITSNYYAARVAGEYIAILDASVEINAWNYQATHKIVSVTRCDANGTADASGTHQLLELLDLGKDYWVYDTSTEYRIAARSYRTGCTSSVSTPSGSPVSNTDGYHPMKYRHRENVYSNQFKTLCDLFDMRVGTGNDDYELEWYYLPHPHLYTPSTTGKPDAAELAGSDFVKLDVKTPHDNYVNGYIKSKKYAADYPDVWIPGVTAGASGSTYFCDYAYLVPSHVVRAVRLGGNWTNGASAGFSDCYAFSAPSSAPAYFGADLFFTQTGGESQAA